MPCPGPVAYQPQLGSSMTPSRLRAGVHDEPSAATSWTYGVRGDDALTGLNVVSSTTLPRIRSTMGTALPRVAGAAGFASVPVSTRPMYCQLRPLSVDLVMMRSMCTASPQNVRRASTKASSTFAVVRTTAGMRKQP